MNQPSYLCSVVPTGMKTEVKWVGACPTNPLLVRSPTLTTVRINVRLDLLLGLGLLGRLVVHIIVERAICILYIGYSQKVRRKWGIFFK